MFRAFRVCRTYQYFIVLSVIIALPTSSIAQENPFGNLLGAMIANAMVQNAQNEWNKLPEPRRSCFVQALGQNGIGVPALIQEGVGPNDQRLAGYEAPCIQQEQERRRDEQAAQEARAAQAKVVKQSWSGLDANVRYCVDRMLKNSNESIDGVIEKGILSSDERLAPIFNTCNPISSSKILKKISCTVEGQPSTCDEAFVLQSAPQTPLTQDQLVTALTAGRGNQIGVAQVETADAKAKRMANNEKRQKQQILDQLLAKLAPLAATENTFSTKQASALVKTISAERDTVKSPMSKYDQWSSDVAKLVEAENNEKMRLQKEAEDMAARGEVRFSIEGKGSSKKIARLNAYYDYFQSHLRELVGNEADGDVGRSFRKLAENDLDKFRLTYFSSDTKEKCDGPESNASCKLEGIFKLAVLKGDIQKMMSQTVGSGSHDYRFILRYPDEQDEVAQYLISQISAAFINSGYKIISKGAEEEAEANKKFDFYLNIFETKHDAVQDVGGNFVTYTLSARLKLMDGKARGNDQRQDLANVPMTNSKRILRDPKVPLEARAKEVLQLQGRELAKSILAEVDQRLLAFVKADSTTAATANGPLLSPTQYAIHIKGIADRDRDKIKAIRAVIAKLLNGTRSEVDANSSGEKEIRITFDDKDNFDPEDLNDALYEIFKDNKKFKIKYVGGHMFEGEY